jgi:methionyl-tRNA formyltransferase
MQQAILNGEIETGVSVMQLDKGCDTGPVFLQKTCAISPQDTSETLLNTLTPLGAQALLETLDAIENGTAKATPQDITHASYASKIEKQDGCISWDKRADEIDCAIRAYQPWPLAYSFIHGDRMNILGAKVLNESTPEKPGTILSLSKAGLVVATGKGTLMIEKIQLPGKKPMLIAALLNGHPHFFQAGMVFNDAP